MADPESREPVPLAELDLRMQPGRYSQVGFLAPGESLSDVLSADARALAEIGCTAQMLADALDQLLAAALEAGGSRTRVSDFVVSIARFKGYQLCPFAAEPERHQCQAGGGQRYGSIDWDIRNRRTGRRLTGPGLIVHLIGAHGFFEGPRAPLRVDPRALAELLQVGVFAR
jgi:hypothetical protein